MSPRRRALLLGGLAVLLGGLAASDVAGREAALRRQVGGLVPVVVARSAVAAGDELRPGQLTTRRVPERFAPAGAFAEPRELAGSRAAVAIAPGTDVVAGLLEAGEAVPGPPVGRGERVAQVVAGAPADLVVAGSRVDVLVTREPRPGAPGRTALALEDVEVLDARPVDAAAVDEGGGGGGGDRVAAGLRVTVRQAVYLAAAQSFAREIRLLPRPPGDRRRGYAGAAYGAALR